MIAQPVDQGVFIVVRRRYWSPHVDAAGGIFGDGARGGGTLRKYGRGICCSLRQDRVFRHRASCSARDCALFVPVVCGNSQIVTRVGFDRGVLE